MRTERYQAGDGLGISVAGWIKRDAGRESGRVAEVEDGSGWYGWSGGLGLGLDGWSSSGQRRQGDKAVIREGIKVIRQQNRQHDTKGTILERLDYKPEIGIMAAMGVTNLVEFGP